MLSPSFRAARSSPQPELAPLAMPWQYPNKRHPRHDWSSVPIPHVRARRGARLRGPSPTHLSSRRDREETCPDPARLLLAVHCALQIVKQGVKKKVGSGQQGPSWSERRGSRLLWCGSGEWSIGGRRERGGGKARAYHVYKSSTSASGSWRIDVLSCQPIVHCVNSAN